MFDLCEICGSDAWEVARLGPVRDGAFGNLTTDVRIGRCGGCGVERLEEPACKDTSFYEGESYRRSLNQATEAQGFMQEHDVLQQQHLNVLGPLSLRGKTIADIGCAAGSFLDHVVGLAARAVAIEPCTIYHDSLQKRGYDVYPAAERAAEVIADSVDVAFSFSVIEHVSNPRTFLEAISRVLTKEGCLLVSTPNRRDALMELAGENYQRFFYRVAHRWYFDEESFSRCAMAAGLRVKQTKYVHRYSLSNAMAWLKESRPTGSHALPHLDSRLLDDFWKSYLEDRRASDYLYFFLERA